MSRQNMPCRPAGAAMAMGLVPIMASRALVGATTGEVLVMLRPIMPASAARMEYQPAMPKWFELRNTAVKLPASRAPSMAVSTATREA